MVLSLRFSALLLWLALWLPGQLRAQTLDPAFHIPEIYRESFTTGAAQMPNGQVVVAGDFTRANGQASQGLARYDAAGVLDQNFHQSLSGATILVVKKLIPIANDQLLVHGNYQAGAVQRQTLFRLNADGTLDPTLSLTLPPAMTSRVEQVFAQPDGRLLLLGSFTSNGTTKEIIRVLDNGSYDPSFSVALTSPSGGSFGMLVQPDGKVILAGPFTQVNGVNTPNIVRLNNDATLDTSFQLGIPMSRLHPDVLALDANGAVLVGGYYYTQGIASATTFFRVLNTGAPDPGFVPAAALAGRTWNQALVQPTGKIVVLSSSLNYQSQLTQLLPNGGIDTSFQQGDGPNGYLTGIGGAANGHFLAWGGLYSFAGQPRTVALVQPGGQVAGFAPALQQRGRVTKIVRQADDKLLIAGEFNSIDGHFTNRVARLLPTGQVDRAFAWQQPNTADWELGALAVQADGQVLIAGAPLGAPVVRLSTSGTPDPGFVPAFPAGQPSPWVYLLAPLANGQVVVGGGFVDAAGKTNLTRLNANGSVEPTFTPPANQTLVYNGVLEANGNITYLTNLRVPRPQQQYSMMRILPSGVLDVAFSYLPSGSFHLDNFPEQIAQMPGSGGYVLGGVMGNGTAELSRVSSNGATLAGFAAPFVPFQGALTFQSGVRAIAAQADGKILVGGYLRQNGQSVAASNFLARLDPTTGQLDPLFNQNIIPPSTIGRAGVNSIVVQPDGAVLVGGDFQQADGQPVTGLVRLLTGGTALRVTPSPEVSAHTLAWPVPAHDVLHLQLVATAQPQRITLTDALGKTVISQAPTSADLTVNTAPLAPGLYLLRVDYASGPVTRRVMVE